MTRPSRPALAAAPVLALAMALVLAACDDGTGIDDGVLAGVDAFAIRDALVLNANVVQAGAGASRVLRHALHSIDAHLTAAPDGGTTIAAEHYGGTFVFDETSLEWEEDEARTGAPGDGIRVIWYQLGAGGTIQTPLVERGHVDVRDLPDAEGARLGITVWRNSLEQVVADYVLEMDEVTTDADWRRNLDADGTVSANGMTLDVSLAARTGGDLDTGDDEYRYDFALTGPGFSYTVAVETEENITAGTLDEAVDVNLDLNGVSTRLLFTASDGDGSFTAGGALFHAGEHVADITFTSAGLAFRYPDGSSVGVRDRQKMEVLTLILLEAIQIINTFL